MKKLYVYLSTSCAVASLLACKHYFVPENGADQEMAQCLKVNLPEGDPPSLHPHMGADIRGRMLGKALFEGLTRLGTSGKGELAAAEHVEIDPSLMRFVFTLRPQTWSNGKTVTAHHFERAWKKALMPDSLCARTDLFYIVKNARKAKCGELSLDHVGIQALDDKTLAIELEHPSPYFLDLISHPIFSPLFNDEDSEPTVFNGPFTIGNWKRGVVLELARNPNYWDAEQVKLNQVSIFMVTDPYTEYSLFEKGELDIVGDPFDSLPLDVLAAAYRDPHFNSKEISRIQWYYLNTEKPPFHSEKIRKAFAYALDRKYLCEHLLVGDSACTAILPNTLTLLDPDQMCSDGDISLAVRLFEEGMKELGLTRETFPPVTLSYCTYGSQRVLTQAIQERLSKVLGIPIEIEGAEWNVFSNQLIHGQFQMGSCTRSALYEDPFYFLEIFKEKGYSYNFTNWEDENYRNLLKIASTTSNPQERLQLLKQAELMLLDAMPVIPVYSETSKYLINDQLEGFAINGSGYADFKLIQFCTKLAAQ